MASLRLRTMQIKSDGTPNDQPFDVEIVNPDTGERILDEKKQPCVVVSVKPMGQAEWREILKQFESFEQDEMTGQTVRRQDFEGAVNELCRRNISGWKGLDGADDKPLVCNDVVKPLLPAPIKTQVYQAILGAKVVAAVDRASFRES